MREVQFLGTAWSQKIGSVAVALAVSFIVVSCADSGQTNNTEPPIEDTVANRQFCGDYAGIVNGNKRRMQQTSATIEASQMTRDEAMLLFREILVSVDNILAIEAHTNVAPRLGEALVQAQYVLRGEFVRDGTATDFLEALAIVEIPSDDRDRSLFPRFASYTEPRVVEVCREAGLL